MEKVKSGIINVYKEKGFTSFDVVAKLRGILKTKKIGHTGTLDPDAEGVLPVCIGRATKVCDILTDKDKVYEAVMLLGVETDTQDTSGEVLKELPVEVSEEAVGQAILSFVGEYAQVPPMYSALKVNGKKLYELAKAGMVEEKIITVDELFSEYPSMWTKPTFDVVGHNGNRIEPRMLQEKLLTNMERLRVYDSEGVFLGIYEYSKERKDYKPVKMFYENNK